MSVHEFKLADVGEGLTEAEIVAWRVQEGDSVKINDIVCEVETAKSIVELPSPYAGTVRKLLVSVGDTVPVGTPLIAIGSAEDDGAPAVTDPAEAMAQETRVERPPADEAIEPGMVGSPAPVAEGTTATLVGYGPRHSTGGRRARRRTAAVGSAPNTAPDAATPPTSPDGSADSAPSSLASVAVLAKPPVRKLAKDLGVDLRSIEPSGPGGTVSRSDVEAAAGSGRGAAGAEPAAVEAPSARVGGETRIPVKGVRKMTAAAMVSSAFTAPHVTEWVTVDVSRTMRMVRKLQADRAFADVKVSPLLLVARAVCLAIRRTPEVNAAWDEGGPEIVLKHYVNLGIAAATPRGLVVPNIKGAHDMSAAELAAAMAEVVAVARAGKTQPAEMAGGTFTITNVGVFGVDSGTPILNPGESAILAVGTIRRQPWVVGRKIRPRWVTTLALSFDHRIVDGEQGSRFLADVAAILHKPDRALLF